MKTVKTLDFSGSVGCDLKLGYFTVLIKICEYLRSRLLLSLTNMTLAKGRLSKTKLR